MGNDNHGSELLGSGGAQHHVAFACEMRVELYRTIVRPKAVSRPHSATALQNTAQKDARPAKFLKSVGIRVPLWLK